MSTDDAMGAAPPGGADGDDDEGDDKGGRRGKRKGKARLRVPEDVVTREKKPAPVPPAAGEPPGDGDAASPDAGPLGVGDAGEDPDESASPDSEGVVVMQPVVMIGEDYDAPGVYETPPAIEVEVEDADSGRETVPAADSGSLEELADDDVQEVEPEDPEPVPVTAAAEPDPGPRGTSGVEAPDQPPPHAGDSSQPTAAAAPPPSPGSPAVPDEAPVPADLPPDDVAAPDPLFDAGRLTPPPPEELDESAIEIDAAPAAKGPPPTPKASPAGTAPPAAPPSPTVLDPPPSTAPSPPAASEPPALSSPPAVPAPPAVSSPPPVPPPPPVVAPPPALPPAVPAAPAAHKIPAMIVPPVPSGAEALGFARAARARRVRAWWEDVFSEEWLRLFPAPPDVQVDREVDFVGQSLGVEKGGWVLDVGCGMGRHAVRLAKRGFQVVGVDLSLSMLARCAEEAQGAGAKISFLHADMRELTFADTYDGAYCIGTTFGYFDDEQNAAAIAGIHRSLKPKGLFLLETVNRDYVVRQLPSLVWFEGEGCVCMEESTFNPITSRLVVRRTMISNDGGQKTADYSVRLYCLHEIGAILHTAGFRVAEVSGSIATPGAFFDAESPQAWILAEKRVAGSRSTISSSTLPAVQPPPPPPRPAAPAPAAEPGSVTVAPVSPGPSRPTPPPMKAVVAEPDPDPAPERTWIPPRSSPLADEKTPPPRRSTMQTRPEMPLSPDAPERPAEPDPEEGGSIAPVEKEKDEK